MWYVRNLKRVKRAFASIWDCDDLLVSFDGGNVFRPWRYKRGWLTDGGWYHVDQNANLPNSKGRVCVQGLVTLCDTTADTGGLCVIPRSHLDHTVMCQRIPDADKMGDHVPIPYNDPVLRYGSRLICAKAGDLILWDSRTVHCNTPALTALTSWRADNCTSPAEHQHSSSFTNETMLEKPWTLIRQVAYVCMTPRRMASAEVLKKRQDGFVNNVSCNHWPHRFIPGSAALPDTPQNHARSISAHQRALIGFDSPSRRCCIQ